jgi:hypothetical protein
LIVISALVIWFFGVRHLRKIRAREDIEQQEWERLDNDADVAGTYRNPGDAGSKSDISSTRGSKRYLSKHANDSALSLPAYDNASLHPSMAEVPMVKDATYIKAPSEHYGDAMMNWGYSDPEIAKPTRTQSPSSRDRQTRQDV